MIRFLLGGTRSGKSALAERALLAGPPPYRVVATGRALDFGFARRIEAHKKARPASVAVIETGVAAMDVLAAEAGRGGSVLLDSLDFWLFTCHSQKLVGDLLLALSQGLAPYAADGDPQLIVVSTEIGLGPIGADAFTRRFVDDLGRLNQAVAAMAHDVRLVVAGRTLALSGDAS